MVKPINLSVHRNTQVRREQKELSKQMLQDTKRMASQKNVSGYVIMVWNKDWGYRVAWDSGKVMPASVVPEFVKSSLQREISKIDMELILNGLPPEDDGA